MAMMQILDIALSVVVFAVIFIIFRLFLWFDVVLNIALLVLSFCLADFIIKMLRDSFTCHLLLPRDDKAVLVTGCDTGFGNKFARELDAKGVTVFAGCLFSDGPGAMKLKQACSKNLHILQLDVTKADQIKSALQVVKENLAGKKLWAVVNNAGILVMSEAEYTSIEATRKVLDVNTLGAARVTQAFLPLLRQSKGRVVIVTSVAGRVSFPVLSSYCMSKQATMAYAQVLRRELLRWGVSVHTVEPWAFKTEMADKQVAEQSLKNEWNQAPESVRAEYGGENYIDKLLQMHMGSDNKEPTTKLHLVTDSMMDAAISRFPKLHYLPGFPGRLIVYLNKILPTSIVDFMLQPVLPKLHRL